MGSGRTPWIGRSGFALLGLLGLGAMHAQAGYDPGIDPVRHAGRFTRQPQPMTEVATLKGPQTAEEKPSSPPKFGAPRVIYDKLKKGDTPAWLPGEKALLFTDLEQEKLYRFDPPDQVAVIREAACRGKAGPDDRLYGLIDGKLVAWKLGDEPQVIADKAANGRELSLNDIAIGKGEYLYFTTLKDPDKGRLSVVNRKSGEVRVLFDGEDEPALANPNGVALSPDGRRLYVGISNYQDRKQSGVYRFPVRDDGTIDVSVGKESAWAAVSGPDGIAIDDLENVYFTAGGRVEVFQPSGTRLATLKIPQGSGTNLALGGDENQTLFITTSSAVYAVDVER